MPAPTLVYEDDALRIFWNEDRGYYLSEWRTDFRKGDALRPAYQACLDAARARPGAPWLADASGIAVIDQADQRWIADWFFPEFIRAGARYQATVIPRKEVGRMSALKAVEKVRQEGELSMTRHASRAEAETAILAWLEKHADD
jgi:hypothetical protein